MAERVDDAAPPVAQTDDERQLAELGYKQELSRAWSGFTNFAISFTIISVLAGTLTTFGLAWNNGRPGRDLVRLADHLRPRPAGRGLDGRADVGVPDCGWPVLVGGRAGRRRLELDDRLVQHRRPGRDRRIGRLRRGDRS